jgi:hypothetical protein
LVRRLLQASNMTMVFHKAGGNRVRRFVAQKKLKIYVAYLTPFATFPRS